MKIFSKQFIWLGVLLAIALAGILFWQRSAVWPYAKRLATKHIVLVQKFRKLSDILFLPQQIFGNDALETYVLEIKPTDWQALNDHLPQGDYYDLEAAGLLSNALSGDNKLFVPAKFVYNGESYKVDVRYRGTTYDHWFYPKKSWLIRFKDKSPLGFQKINLIIPDDRSYLGEQLSNYRARKLGLLAPESGFVNFAVNSVSQGVYWWVEDESPVMLAENGQSKNGCLFGADTTWHEGRWQDRALVDATSWNEYTAACGGASGPILKSFLDWSQLEPAVFLAQAENIIDVKSVLTWDALGRLQGSKHGQPYNLRLYYDDVKKKFAFIPWDFGLRSILAPEGDIDAFYNDIVAKLLVKPEYYNQRNQILWDYVGLEKNLQDDLSFYDDLLNKTKAAWLRDANKNESNLEFTSKVKQGRLDIVDNVERIKKFLSVVTQPFAYVEDRGAGRQIRVETTNAIPVYLAEIECPVKCAAFNIYYDINQNNAIDPADRKLALGEKKKDIELLDKIPINAERSALRGGNDTEKITSQPAVFILQPLAGAIDIANVILRNYVTNDKVSPTVKFISHAKQPANN